MSACARQRPGSPLRSDPAGAGLRPGHRLRARSSDWPLSTMAPSRIAPFRAADEHVVPNQDHKPGLPAACHPPRPRFGARHRRPDDAGRVPLVGILKLPVGFVGANEAARDTCAIPFTLVWSTVVRYRKALPVSSLNKLRATLNHRRTLRNNVDLGNRVAAVYRTETTSIDRTGATAATRRERPRR